MQSILMAASAVALLHSTMVTSGPLIPDGANGAAMPQNGVWALVPAECETPTSLDLANWPKCVTPIGFADDEVAALERPGPGKKATSDAFYSMARTKYAMAPATAAGGPEVVQVVVPMVFSRSYYFLSITPDALDADGRFATARGWPVACADKDKGGCNPKALADVQAQAASAPTDPQRLYKLVRIQPPAADTPAITPAPAGPTTAAPTTAAPTTAGPATTAPATTAPAVVAAPTTAPSAGAAAAVPAPGVVTEKALPPAKGAAPAPTITPPSPKPAPAPNV